MTNPLRIAVLAVLTAFVVASVPTGAIAAKKHQIFCENAKDCKKGDICWVKPHHITGICIAVKKKSES